MVGRRFTGGPSRSGGRSRATGEGRPAPGSAAVRNGSATAPGPVPLRHRSAMPAGIQLRSRVCRLYRNFNYMCVQIFILIGAQYLDFIQHTRASLRWQEALTGRRFSKSAAHLKHSFVEGDRCGSGRSVAPRPMMTPRAMPPRGCGRVRRPHVRYRPSRRRPNPAGPGLPRDRTADREAPG
jgi:hypothetical protein